MSVQIFMCRLFGGRDLGVSFDSVAQSLTIAGQQIAISSLPAELQVRWQAAIGGAISGIDTGPRPAFGGNNISSAVGAILDSQPLWRAAVTAALATVVSEQTLGGLASDVQSFNRTA